MNKKLLTATLALLAVPAIAAAAPMRSGAYVSGFLGANIAKDSDVTAYDFTGTQQIDDRVEFDPGIYIGGTGGYDFGMIRLEGEISYKHAEMKAITDNFPPPTHYRDVDGSLGVLAFMANAYFDLHNDSPVTPYWGGGIGFANLHLSDTYVNGGGGRFYREDDATAFAYQAGLGLEIALNQRVSLDVGYRYFGTSKEKFDRENQLNSSTAETKFESHNVLVGARIKF